MESHSIVVMMIFSFKVSKAFYLLSSPLKTCLTLVKACKGDAIYEKIAIKFTNIEVPPRKLLTSVEELVLGQFTITSTLEGSIFKLRPPTT
jgi:hypothetical protein